MPTVHMAAQPPAGSYRRVRTFSLNASSWTEVDLTGTDWAGHASVPAKGREAAARARLTHINLRISGATPGDSVDVSHLSNAGTGGQAYLSADHQVMLSMPFPMSERASKWYWRTSGALTVQVEVYFDILNETEV